MPDNHADTLKLSTRERSKANGAEASRAHQPQMNATYSAAAEFARTFAPGANPMSTDEQQPATPTPGGGREISAPPSAAALPTTQEERRAYAATMRKALSHLNRRGEIEREVASHFGRHGAITKAEKAEGRRLDNARTAEDQRHLATLETATVSTLGDVRAVLDMLRRERAAKSPSRADRVRARLLNGAAAVIKDVQEAILWSVDLAPPPVYPISTRTAALLGAELARIREANAAMPPEREAALNSRALAAINQMPRETAEHCIDLLGLYGVMHHAYGALTRIARDDLDRQHLANQLRSMLARTEDQVRPSGIIPDLGMTFRQAADRVRELLDLNAASAQRDEDEDGEEGPQRRRNDAERHRLEKAIIGTPAASIRDVLVKLERLTDPEVGARYFEVEPETLHAIQEDLDRLAVALPAPSTPSDDIATAFIDWQRAERFKSMVKQAVHDAAEQTEERAALEAFAEAAEQTTWDVKDGLLDVEAVSLHDALLQLRVVLEVDDTALSNIFSSGARNMLEALARAQSFPAMPLWSEERGRPVTDDDWRVYLTADPTRMHEATPADLLRLFTIDEGAEVFAMWSGYVRARTGTADEAAAARAGFLAYGDYHRAADSFGARVLPGDALTDEEREHLAAFGRPSADAVRRLEANVAAFRKRTEGCKLNDLSGLKPDEAAFVASFRALDELGKQVLSSIAHVELTAQKIQDGATSDQPHPHASEHAAIFADALRRTLADLATIAGGATTGEDAQLLALVRERAEVVGRLRAMTEDEDPDFTHPLWHTRDELTDRLTTIQPQTAAGVTALLGIVYELTAERLVEIDGPAPDSEAFVKLLWAAMKAAERMAGVSAPARAVPDTFTETVAAFEAEAPAPLSMPQAPTAAMLEAGAAAAGLSEEQVRAVYEAMAGAYRQERSAA